eukprot:CAMPEP_0182538278 /NCGR_PEP_ID=MMETSP1323-20130603/23437_1 /TAXON_ID=236787 /ORGANISM="Florenciella parvula, Strain RCC1693" /LENGTH=34 /DNA_ID= /DNA_START= /DNA_END= /DNA_ORIENTATION=
MASPGTVGAGSNGFLASPSPAPSPAPSSSPAPSP